MSPKSSGRALTEFCDAFFWPELEHSTAGLGPTAAIWRTDGMRHRQDIHPHGMRAPRSVLTAPTCRQAAPLTPAAAAHLDYFSVSDGHSGGLLAGLDHANAVGAAVGHKGGAEAYKMAVVCKHYVLCFVHRRLEQVSASTQAIRKLTSLHMHRSTDSRPHNLSARTTSHTHTYTHTHQHSKAGPRYTPANTPFALR